MAQDLENLTQQLLDAARKAGAEAADALAIESDSIAIDVLKGKLENAERTEGVDLGLRVLIGARQANVSVSDVRPETIAAMAERAVAMAREAPEDPTVGLADPTQIARHLDIAALDLVDTAGEPAPADLQRAAMEAEAAALAVKGVSQVSSASASYSSRRMHLAASNGFSGGYGRTGHSISCVAITGSGTEMERDYHGEGRGHLSDMPSAQEIGRIAGERTVALAGARKPKTGAYPMLYDERIAGSLMGHLLSAINGTAIARGASWLRDALGEQVLPAGMSLIGDPHRPRISASRPFDAEGLATRRVSLVEDGVLRSWVLDLATGRKLGLDSTAHGTRGTSSIPSPSVGNVALSQGTKSRDELLREMGTGLLITSMIGASINPTTGDYSRGASGFWVENGEIAYPVNECTVAGNLRDMLKTIIPANDARHFVSHQAPSLLVEGLTLAGE
ncbi:MAG: TldD/PmbA family protein [Rhodobacteraceae bacterium]|nr:TldD/PmbA family protein [Paracoccaceae bacterium]